MAKIGKMRLALLSITCGITILFFNNCTPYLRSGSAKFSSTATPFSENYLKGISLYSAKCMGCHSDFATSTKKGRVPEEIRMALQNVSAMQLLKLTAEEIRLISDALSGITGDPAAGPAAKFACLSPGTRGQAEKKMRRLNRQELVNTLIDLLGTSIMSDPQIKVQLGLLPTDKLDSGVGDISANHASTHVQAMLTISTRVAELAFANATSRDLIFGSCSGQTTIADSCVQDFLKNFGLLVYRRPLVAAESLALFNYYKSTGGIEGLKRSLMRLLLSPSLAFHLETNGIIEGNRQRLSDYEVASRLAYRLTGTMPDTALLQAASNGSLKTLTGVKAQADRLLATSLSAKARVEDFFRFYLQTDKIPEPYAPAAQLQGLNTTGLREEMIQETKDYVSQIVWSKKGNFQDLYTSREVFPRSERMAKILETTVMTAAAPSTTNPEHAGILLRPGILSNPGDRTNAFHRSAFVRKRILCEKFGSPDPALIAERQAEIGDISKLGNRNRLTHLTSVPQCMACHARVNPTAFVFEGYDQLGMRRSMETIFDTTSKPAATAAINTRVENTYVEDDRGPVLVMESALDLNHAMIRGRSGAACFAQTIFEYQRAREYVAEDLCALSDLEKAVTGATSVLEAFTLSIVNEDIFWKAKGN